LTVRLKRAKPSSSSCRTLRSLSELQKSDGCTIAGARSISAHIAGSSASVDAAWIAGDTRGNVAGAS